MNALVRFFSLGMQDADRRLAAALTPRSSRQVDQYLRAAALVSAMDRLTLRLQEWWMASDVRRRAELAVEAFGDRWPRRYQSIAVAILAAVSVHVLLTVANGPRPGWFWLVLPAMAMTFGVLLLMGSTAEKR